MYSGNLRNILERPDDLLLCLLALDLLFVMMFVLAMVSGSWTLMQWFNVESERSIATWYSSSQLLVSGLLVLLTVPFYDARYGPSTNFCLLVGLGLVFLSADEASSIHERLTLISIQHAQFIPLFRGNHGAWVTIYGLLGLFLVAVNIGNVTSMWRQQRRVLVMFGTGFATLVSGAVIVEVAGYYSLLPSDAMQLIIEEGLEMIGGSTILVSTAVFFGAFVKLRAATPPATPRD